MVMVIFFTMTKESPNVNGNLLNMQGSGACVFTFIVIVVNMKILISSFEITFILLILVIASIVAYFACLWFATYYSAESDDFGAFYELLTFPETYVTLLFFAFSYVLIDAGMRYASLEINAIYMRRKELQEFNERLAREALKEKSIQRRISRWDSKYSNHLLNFIYSLDRGFAFSQEAGNDRLVTDSLKSRIGRTLSKPFQKIKEITVGKSLNVPSSTY